MLNTIIALWMLGHDWSDPVLDKAWRDFLALGVETEDQYWMQPCFSPIWDTPVPGSRPGCKQRMDGRCHALSW